MLYGGLFLGGGALFTWISWTIAASGGGVIVVATGAIAYGAIRFLRGLVRRALL